MDNKTDTDSERASFEYALKSLAAKRGETLEDDAFYRSLPFEEYDNGGTEIAWMIWQARASLAASAGSEPVAVLALRMLVAAGHITQAKADESLRLAADYTHPSPPEGAGTVSVPKEFIQGFNTLAHNYSLRANPPDYYDGMAGDAFSAAYRRCGQDLAELRAMLSAPPASEAKGATQ